MRFNQGVIGKFTPFLMVIDRHRVEVKLLVSLFLIKIHRLFLLQSLLKRVIFTTLARPVSPLRFNLVHEPRVPSQRPLSFLILNFLALGLIMSYFLIKPERGRITVLKILRFPFNHLRNTESPLRVLPGVVLMADTLKIRYLELPRVLRIWVAELRLVSWANDYAPEVFPLPPEVILV